MSEFNPNNMYLVKLATVLENMNQFQTAQSVDVPTKVRWIDMVLRDEELDYKLPFRRHQTTLRVFDSVLIYPVPSDYDELCYVDNDEIFYEDRARFRYESFDQFLQDPDNRNDLCEITDGEQVFLGCRYRTKNAKSIVVDNAESIANYTCSGDASNPVLDNVFFKEGNGSIRFTIFNSTGSAVIENTFASMSDLLYRRKYNFRYVYLDGVPTSISMRFGDDSGNYLYATTTKQFSGQDFKAGAWNLIAFDLNIANVQGTIDATKWAYQGLIFTGAPSGTYYVDTSYLRDWELLDNFWYYSTYAVKSAAGVYKETFIDPVAETYDITDYLIGPTEFANYIAFLAVNFVAIDKNDTPLIQSSATKAKDVGDKIPDRYKMVKPIITNQAWRFRGNLMSGYNNSYGPNGLVGQSKQ